MKKRALTLALTLCLCLSLGIAVQAKEIPIYSDISGKQQYTIGSNKFSVKFNGEAVSFPDAQPFVDEHDRTLVPLRFVTEKMGATVTWDEKTASATVVKDGTSVDITIGSSNITLTKNGEASTIVMDTKALLKDGRTFVPVRFVAESLGAWVGYSDLFNTAQIYDDVLTPKEIARLHSYPDPTWEEQLKLTGDKSYGVTNESWEETYPQIAYFSGTGDNGFCNANEWAICEPEGAYSLDVPTYPVEAFTGILSRKPFKFGVQENIDCAKIAMEEAALGVAAQFKDVDAKLRCDLSCVFSSRHYSNGTMLVRGVMTITIPENADINAIESKYGISNGKAGGSYSTDVEIKIATYKGKIGAVEIATLGNAKGDKHE
ncbi:MAG: copper amine oxidase N-terminal domain-containing protein [Oscillospiraceae bacterium]